MRCRTYATNGRNRCRWTDAFSPDARRDGEPAAGSAGVFVEVVDEDLGFDEEFISAQNTPPRILSSTANWQAGCTGKVVLTSLFDDPDDNEFTVMLDWGDGTAPETFTSGRGFQRTHEYRVYQPRYNISYSVTDSRRGAAPGGRSRW